MTHFKNDRLRIGPPAIDKTKFYVIRNNRKVKGKREEIPVYLASLGLDLYEYNAGRGFKLKSRNLLTEFRENCKKYDIMVTVHGPYYISLCSDNLETLERSIKRIAELYHYALWLGAVRAVFHPGGYGKKRSKEDNLKLVINSIKKGIQLAEELYPQEFPEFKNIALCPETAGKRGSLGTLDEIISICMEIGSDKCIPTIDFGHLYAHSLGKIKKREDFLRIFNIIEKELGKDVAENLHIHYSRVEYTDKGEKVHCINSETSWGPDYKPLIQLIHELGYKPTFINESPNLESDAIKIMKYYKML
ncbi:MAG: TIM barrel protein [Promethearchaeota archaeon]